jgi:hypothetical protein
MLTLGKKKLKIKRHTVQNSPIAQNDLPAPEVYKS